MQAHAMPTASRITWLRSSGSMERDGRVGSKTESEEEAPVTKAVLNISAPCKENEECSTGYCGNAFVSEDEDDAVWVCMEQEVTNPRFAAHP
jgi:hypothetical protein